MTDPDQPPAPDRLTDLLTEGGREPARAWLEQLDGSDTTVRTESDITIVVLHDSQQAARLADQLVALKGGEIQARGTPEEVVTEELLAEVFDIDAEVDLTPRGPRIEPLRPRHDDRGQPTEPVARSDGGNG